MSRRVRILLGLMTLASLFITLGALGWRWREAGDVAAILSGPKPARPIMLLIVPFLLAGLLAFATRRHKPQAQPL